MLFYQHVLHAPITNKGTKYPKSQEPRLYYLETIVWILYWNWCKQLAGFMILDELHRSHEYYCENVLIYQWDFVLQRKKNVSTSNRWIWHTALNVQKLKKRALESFLFKLVKNNHEYPSTAGNLIWQNIVDHSVKLNE